jgi:hypothetical protein
LGHPGQHDTPEPAHEQAHDQRRGETEQAPVGERVGGVGADEVEGAVGEVEHVHHPEDERQPDGEREQQQPERHPVDHADEVVVEPLQDAHGTLRR